MNDLAKELAELDELGYWEYSVATDGPDSVRIDPTTYSVILEVILNGRYYYREVGVHKATEAFDPEYWAEAIREGVMGDPMRAMNLLLDINIESGYFTRKVYFDLFRDTTSFGVDDHRIPEADSLVGRMVYLADGWNDQSLTLAFKWEEDAVAFYTFLERKQQQGATWDNMVFDLIQNLTLIKEMKDAAEADHAA